MSISSKQAQAIRIISGLSKKLKNSPWVKKIGLPLLAAWITYLLTLVPVSQSLEKCNNCSPLKTSRNQTLWVANIISEKANAALFEYVVEPKQAINIHFDNARLDDNTLNLLSHFLPDIPRTPQAINFHTLQNKESKVFVKVILRKPTTMPNTLYLSRELTHNKTQPDFKMKAEMLELAVQIAQISSLEGTVADDKSDLVIGNWHSKVSGIQLTIIPENNTDLAFRFDLTEWDPTKPFEAFFIPGLNNPNREITAQGLGTSATVDGSQVIDDLLCAAPGNEKILWLGSKNFRNGACPATDRLKPLKLTAFKIGKEELHISASEHAWAKINDELTYNVITYAEEKIKNNPVLKQLFERLKGLIGL